MESKKASKIKVSVSGHNSKKLTPFSFSLFLKPLIYGSVDLVPLYEKAFLLSMITRSKSAPVCTKR